MAEFGTSSLGWQKQPSKEEEVVTKSQARETKPKGSGAEWGGRGPQCLGPPSPPHVLMGSIHSGPPGWSLGAPPTLPRGDLFCSLCGLLVSRATPGAVPKWPFWRRLPQASPLYGHYLWVSRSPDSSPPSRTLENRSCRLWVFLCTLSCERQFRNSSHVPFTRIWSHGPHGLWLAGSTAERKVWKWIRSLHHSYSD